MRKKYIIISVVVVLISIIALIGASYAVLTMTLEGDKKVSLTAGILKVDFLDGNYITLDNAGPMTDSKGLKTEPYIFTITNNGNIDAYYHILLEEDNANTLPNNNLKMKLTGDNGYDSGILRVSDLGSGYFEVREEDVLNPTKKVTYKLWMWLDEEADNSTQGKVYKSKIVVESFDRTQTVKVSDAVLTNLGDNGDTYDDGIDTFITGEEPNNYIWYSGKLWRAVSVNNETKTAKLVTQWNISIIPYNEENNTAFKESHMEAWLNDTTVDGFLGNLRDYEKFIVTNAKWDATLDTTPTGSIERPAGTTIVTDAEVGLLNMYEYQTSYRGTDYSNGYLNNGLRWWSITPLSSSEMRYIGYSGYASNYSPATTYGIRPSINLKSNIQIVSGDGTLETPYRLKGDNDKNLKGTRLSSRYSGEYIHFGIGENNLYRIVSYESEGLTKITSAEPLKKSGAFKTMAFGNDIMYSSTNTIGTFLNGEYLTSYVGEDNNMVEDTTTWYLGEIRYGASYKLAKYKDINMGGLTNNTTNAKVGLLRLGELMAGQFARYGTKGGGNTDLTVSYWVLTPYNASYVRYVHYIGSAGNGGNLTEAYGVSPSINLKSNVIIISGEGTKEKPFEIALGSK